MNTSKKMASVLTEANMFAIGMIANIAVKRKNKLMLKDYPDVMSMP